MADTVLIEIEIPKKGFVNIDADIPEKEAIEVDSREQSFIFHDELLHRDIPNQHPIGAITELQAELDRKATKQALDEETERATTAEQSLGERIDNIPQPDLSPYAKKSELARVATTGKYADLHGKPTIPTQASDVHALPDTTKYGSSLSLTINDKTYILTAQLKDQNGDNLGTAQTVDLPLETMVVGAEYDENTKELVLTLKNGQTIRFSIADLVSGLQPTIPDLDEIRDGASKGETAVQPSKLDNYALKSELPVIPTKVSAFENDKGYLTEHQDISGLATKSYVDYSLIKITPTAIDGNSEISLQNRAITTVTVDDTVNLLTFIFPEKVDGKARDFFVRLVIIGESIPTLSFIEANGNPVPFDIDDESWAEIEQGVNILMFTDTKE